MHLTEDFFLITALTALFPCVALHEFHTLKKDSAMLFRSIVTSLQSGTSRRLTPVWSNGSTTRSPSSSCCTVITHSGMHIREMWKSLSETSCCFEPRHPATVCRFGSTWASSGRLGFRSHRSTHSLTAFTFNFPRSLLVKGDCLQEREKSAVQRPPNSTMFILTFLSPMMIMMTCSGFASDVLSTFFRVSA